MNYSGYKTYFLERRLVTSISLPAEFTILSPGERSEIVPDDLEIGY
jgi:hypothetical protein